MKAIIGLGNPGKKYSKTRHNLGYVVIDNYAKIASASFKAGKGEYVYSKPSKNILLLKPTTYMNNSGFAVKTAMDYFNIHESEITIVYDDLDLPFGKIKYKEKGRSGGHKGVEDIIYHLSSHVFPRLKLGIANENQTKPSENFVMNPFNKKEVKLLDDVVAMAIEILDFSLLNSATETMNKFNGKSINSI